MSFKRCSIGVGLLLLLFFGCVAFAQEDKTSSERTPQLHIKELPTMTLTAVPALGAAPLTVGFLAQVTDPENAGIATVRYNFGDGHVSALPPPNLVFNTYSQPGIYLVTAAMTTTDGRAATAFTSVSVSRSSRSR